MSDKAKIGAWVRAGFVLLGAFAIVLAVELVNPVINVLAFSLAEDSHHEGRELFAVLIGTIVAPGALFGCGYYLIRNCSLLSKRLLKVDNETIPYWEYAAYRLGFTLVGILYLSWILPVLGVIASNLALGNDFSMAEQYRRDAWVNLVWFGVQGAIGVYLVVGAPHIIRWQAKRRGDVTCEGGQPGLERQSDDVI